MEIRGDPRQFHLRLRDGGKGIDQQVLKAGGREGQHGLPGMQERAKLGRDKLAVWSKPGSGTKIGLTIQANRAAADSRPASTLVGLIFISTRAASNLQCRGWVRKQGNWGLTAR